MRATEYLLLVVTIGIFAYLIIAGAGEFNQVYPDNPIDTTGFKQYEDFNNITQKANKSIENFQKLGDESKWYQKIGAGIVAIPYAVIQFPIMIVSSVTTLTGYMANALGGIIPAPILLALGTFLLIALVRGFMEFFQKSRA